MASSILPQGPNVHCGNLEPHDKHPNMAEGLSYETSPESSWCDGVVPLGDFVEFLVRVPLTQGNNMCAPEDLQDMGFEGTLQWLQDEGLMTFLLDFLDNVETTATLRLRCCGEDRAFPIVEGEVRVPEE